MKSDPIRNLEKGHIEVALKEIDSIPTRDGLEDLLADIEKTGHDSAVPLILFAKAHVYERLERYQIAYNTATKAGQLGLAAGFYRAGRILDEQGSSLNLDRSATENARALFAKGADLGHVWCKIEVLRNGPKTKFRMYRFLIAAPIIVASTFSKKARMSVLY